MKNNKIITHVELPVNPEFIDEVISNAIQNKGLILLKKQSNLKRKYD